MPQLEHFIPDSRNVLRDKLHMTKVGAILKQFNWNRCATRNVYDLITFVQIERHQPAASPVQSVEDDQVAATGGDRISPAGHAVTSQRINERLRLFGMCILDRKL